MLKLKFFGTINFFLIVLKSKKNLKKKAKRTKPEMGFVISVERLLKLVNTAMKTPFCFSDAQRTVITPIAAKSAAYAIP